MEKIIFVWVCLISVAAHSQSLERSVTSTSGNYFYKAGTGSLSYTVGESAVSTFVNANNILTQGFQQTDTSEIAFYEEINSSFYIEIFPNPVTQFLTVKNDAKHKFLFSFYDEAGRLIDVPKWRSDVEIIFDLSKLAIGFYTLSANDTESKTFATKLFIKQ